MRLIDSLLRLGGARTSLHKRIRAAQLILVGLMLVPALVSISLMLVFSSQYHSVIAHMRQVTSLMPLVQNELISGLSDIVVGRIPFDEGDQYQTIVSADAQLQRLIQSGAASKMQLEVAGRTLDTMTNLIDKLGEQMRQEAPVDLSMALMDEIRDVGDIFVESLQDSINAEIDASAVQSDNMQRTIGATLATEFVLLTATLLFALFAQRSLSRSIQRPIEQLKVFAGRIASGELGERAQQPDVEELQQLTRSLNTMAERLQQLMRESTEEQQNLKKSELRALQSQITPHFLYNTLDAIIWLAESKRYSEVIEITGALSNFYRTSLSGGRDWISIEQERGHLEGYLTILRVRYRDILKYRIDIDERLMQRQILKLLIQPLVENALYHGIKNRRGGGLVAVSIQQNGAMMQITVSDNGAGMDGLRLGAVRRALARSEPLAGDAGYGLQSVDRRIKLCYNQPDGLQIDSEIGEGTTVTFRVPVKDEIGADEGPAARTEIVNEG